jgi:probable selenium-dependent hydroxylase accessory protein YqeC
LKATQKDLLTALNINPVEKEHVAVVGGGGKSTLCQKLCEALVKAGAKVVTSTTTKVRERETQPYPRVLLFSFGEVELDAIRAELDEVESVFVGREFIENGKIKGISSAEEDLIFDVAEVGHLITEADGAAGRPLKAPADHEPVIPGSSTTVIAVMGLTALGNVLSPEVVFRPAHFKALTGLKEGDPLVAENLVSAFDERMGLFKNSPSSARRVAFLNQLDMASDRQAAFDLAEGILVKHAFVERVVLGSLKNDEFLTVIRN